MPEEFTEGVYHEEKVLTGGLREEIKYWVRQEDTTYVLEYLKLDGASTGMESERLSEEQFEKRFHKTPEPDPWTLSLDDFRAGRPPALVRKPDGGPLRFAHKAEGLAVIDKNRVFVVHDDDRVTGRREVADPETQFRRLPHQAAYSIVALDESAHPAGKSPALKLNCGRP